MDWKLALQLTGVALGLLYLWLEYRADIRLWIVGLVMPVVHGALYYKAGLYADCSMQVYYVLAGLYGWIVWHNARQRNAQAAGMPEKAAAIGHTPLRKIPALAGVFLAAHGALYLLLARFTDSTCPSGTASPRRSRSWRCGCSRANTSSSGSCGWPRTW